MCRWRNSILVVYYGATHTGRSAHVWRRKNLKTPFVACLNTSRTTASSAAARDTSHQQNLKTPLRACLIRPEQLRRRRRRARYIPPKKSEGPLCGVSKSSQNNCVIGGGASHQKNLKTPLAGYRNPSIGSISYVFLCHCGVHDWSCT